MAEALDPELFYQCTICFEDMTKRKPRLISCHHSFCEECLQKITKRSDITCPVCRQVTHVTNNDVTTLSMDFKLLQMKEREATLSLWKLQLTVTVPKDATCQRVEKPKLIANLVTGKWFHMYNPQHVRCLKNTVVIAEWKGSVIFLNYSGTSVQSHKIDETQGVINGLYTKDGDDLLIVQTRCISKINIYNSDVKVYKPEIDDMKSILDLEGTKFLITTPGNRCIYEYDADKNIVKNVLKDLGYSSSIALVKRAGDVLYVSTHRQGCIKIHNQNGQLLKSVGSDTKLGYPSCVKIINDYILVGDWGDHRVRCFNMDGDFIKNVLTKQDGIQYPWDMDFQFPYLWLIENEEAKPKYLKAFQIMDN